MSHHEKVRDGEQHLQRRYANLQIDAGGIIKAQGQIRVSTARP